MKLASISTQINLIDKMSEPLYNIIDAVQQVTTSMLTVDDAINKGFDTEAIQNASRSIDIANQQMDEMMMSIRKSAEEQQNFNNKMQKGTGIAGKLGTAIKSFVGLYAMKQTAGWIKESLDLTNVQINAERQLQTVLHNVGAVSSSFSEMQNDVNSLNYDVEQPNLTDYEYNINAHMEVVNDPFQSIKDTASEIQGQTLYGDEVMIGGAAEIATYISDADAIEAMMGTLSNYAAGMSDGGEVEYGQMVEYATQLGKALDGTYDGLKKKGFELSESQQKIIENGTDMEKALVLDEVINQSWAGLAEQMANTPQGQLIQMSNSFGDIREEVGARLYPSILELFNTINSNMSQVESAFMGFSSVVQVVVRAITNVVEMASVMYSVITDNWSILAPIIFGIVTALGLYATTVGLTNIVNAISVGIQTKQAIAIAAKTGATIAETAATHKLTVAQWALNSAFLTSPITWVIGGIILLITVIYMVVGAINKFTGTSISATGIIFGAFAWLGAMIVNIAVGAINAVIQLLWSKFVEPFIGIIEFILNVTQGGFDSLGGAVANLIGQIISWFLSLGKVVTKIIDAIFGTDWTSGLNSLQDSVRQWGQNENAITLERTAPVIDYRLDATDAFDSGYNFGESIDSKITGMFSFDDMNDPYGGFDPSTIPGNLEDIEANTSGINDSVSSTQEDLKYIRDMAEVEAVNRFTTAEIKIEQTNHNNINSSMDVDGMVDSLTTGVNEAMEKAAEGVHE